MENQNPSITETIRKNKRNSGGITIFPLMLYYKAIEENPQGIDIQSDTFINGTEL